MFAYLYVSFDTSQCNRAIVILFVSVVLFLLTCALSSKPGAENDREESYHAKTQTSNLEVTISGKDEQSLSASTDATREGVNISSDYNPLTRGIQGIKANNTRYPLEATRPKYVHKSPMGQTELATDVLQPGDSDGITYVAAKGSNQARDGIRHEFLNAPRISESFVVTNPVKGIKEDEVGNGKNKETGNKLARQEESSSSVARRNAAGAEGNVTKSPTNLESNAPREAEASRAGNDGVAAGEDSITGGVSWTEGSFADETPGENPSRLIGATQNVATLKSAGRLGIGNYVESRTGQEEEWQPGEDDLAEAANFGLRAMHDLYHVQEPKLYSMGKH